MGRLSLRTRRANARFINARVQRAWVSRNFMGIGKRATLTTTTLGTNANMFFFSRVPGLFGNSTRVRINIAGASTPLTVSVAGQDISINSATNASSVATSTTNEIERALRATPAASALVHVNRAPGNDGTTIPAALAYTNLSGGIV